ncbi:MAG: succinate--CoA ligase subunit beta [Elusimicrobia bacterium CG1_02_63_36]|nr:MAG: succinate--CoA ligase subunit beta [Elusimicrobia bacterium CG1_02_63_36]PIP83790.1 MAG: ADP-forming succinate--CoA ligase subunit beta [Elusimicrobia bacterium CG22_combo_CG10-13_8_21_14_all_63_91]PJA13193.1 MAG: ADP-forming succinate--CoA ligase subunit beta [Elusimicrobia bacterium CG_4_10_14_0_2_um_filter_63_34]
MKLLEYESKDIFRAYGIPVPPTGGVIKDAGKLPNAIKKAGKGPWVLKAQVLAGGRGKGGGVKLAKTPKDAREIAKKMVGMTLITHQTGPEGLLVKEVLVDKASDISREIYFSIVMDRKSGKPTIIASAEGGVEIEVLAKERPSAILKMPVDPDRGLEAYQGRRLAYALDIPNDRVLDFVKMATKLVKVFLDLDASLVEVNPLIITPKNELIALDAKIVTDDNALFRQESLAERRDPEITALEREAKEVGLSYIALDGNIGCMVNGAGLAMGTMDTVSLAGGSPANFLDVGGGANEEQVTRALQIILKDKKVTAVLVNIFGGIMRCDTIAKGVIAAAKKVKLKLPLIVRLEGTNVKEGKALLRKSGLAMEQADSLWEAAQKAVAAAGGAR